MRKIGVGPFLESDDLREEVRIFLCSGGVLIFPTDTLYGIGVNPDDRNAMAALYRLKGREANRPVPLLLTGERVAEEIFSSFSPLERNLAKAFWPGKLTIVGKRKGEEDMVGLRVPECRVAKILAGFLGGAITGTSANKKRGDLPGTVKIVIEEFLDDDVWILKGGDLPPSKGSTVVKVISGRVEILREGDISSRDILKAMEAMEG